MTDLSSVFCRGFSQDQAAADFPQSRFAGNSRTGAGACQGFKTGQGSFNVAIVVNGQDLIKGLMVGSELTAVYLVVKILKNRCAARQHGNKNQQDEQRQTVCARWGRHWVSVPIKALRYPV
ncbi:hypothetical protein [Desulfosarcina ovata]|uniref:hypothetical protein n=1 Tax=Desulfosarcina ovata TaxID=83564 RepID=UPI0038B2E14E